MKIFITILAAVLFTVNIFAQSPEKMSYQAVIRNNSDQLITNQQVGLQISILQGSVSGGVVYAETQTPSTNPNGLISIEIGNGTVVSGNFTTIDWSNGSYFIKTETDPAGGSNYTITGTSQILSVPYALHAKTAASITGGIMEADPVFSNSQAAQITATDINKLSDLSGVNTGDQDLSGFATQSALQDTASSIRAAKGGSPWTSTGNNIYFQRGLVGIGRSSAPTASLDIYDNVGYQFLKFESTDNVYTSWISTRSGVHDYQIGIDAGNNKFSIANITTGYYPFTIHGQNIGLGTLNPEAPLHINDFMKLEPRNSTPSSPTKGMIYFDSNDDKVKVYTGSTWENLN